MLPAGSERKWRHDNDGQGRYLRLVSDSERAQDWEHGHGYRIGRVLDRRRYPLRAVRKGKEKMGNFDIYQHITDSVIEGLKKGNIVWNKPWRNAHGDIDLQRNLNSKRPYRGINQWLLMFAAMDKGYGSPYWLTFKGAVKAGIKWDDESEKAWKAENPGKELPATQGHVRKGEKSTIVVFWKIVPNKRYDKNDPDSGSKTIPLLRYYRVFNYEQCENLKAPKDVRIPDEPEDLSELYPHLPKTFLNQDSRGFSPIMEAVKIVQGYKDAPSFKHNGGRAYYDFVNDHIEVPEPDLFNSPAEYYSTRFHEMIHSTGHKDRLSRKFGASFGDEKYSKEELVAEMGAAMLCGVAGIEPTIIDNSVAYIKNWVSKLKEDKKLIISASAQAQKASDFILGERPNYDENED